MHASRLDPPAVRIGLGGSWFYGRPEEGLLPAEHGIAMVRRALDLGITWFDTAPLYGRGRSEEILGLALRDERRPHFLATKVGYLPEPFDYSRDTVWRGFEQSLRRLGRDRVDLIQVHESEQAGWDGLFAPGRTMEALREIREQGLATHIGVTGSDLDLLTRCVETGEFASVITYLRYDLLTRDACRTLVPAAARSGTAVICASPLHFGLLGRKRNEWLSADRYPGIAGRLGRLEAVLSRVGEPVARTAIRYLLSDPRVSVILTGSASIAELEDVMTAAAAGPLDDGLRAEIESLQDEE